MRPSNPGKLSSPDGRPSVLGRLSAALVCLAVAFVFTSGKAYASCGDYVVIGEPQSGHGTMTDSRRSGAQSPRESPCPCQGPSCSRGSLPPLTPPVSMPSIATDHWATFVLAPNISSSKDFVRIADTKSVHPIHLGATIFRPPC